MTDLEFLVINEAFLLVYHQDHANAAMHTAAVRYSPLTFRLAEMLADRQTVEVARVLHAAGHYTEDAGR